jgi:branched-chain amino acid transport system ATP-binding protein
MDEKMLDVNGVYVYYGVIGALQDVSLRIGEGEAVALIGPNGAGKTTLIQTISGILRPKRGKVIFMGKEITRMAPYEIVKRGIVQVPEGRLVYPHFSVLENLRMGAYVEKRGERVREGVARVFQIFPVLQERIKQKAGTLSGGEQQMLAIARALMSKPKLLLLDEPSLGLAPNLVEGTLEAIKWIHQEGTTVLLVEQNAFAALEIAGRAYILEGGQIVLQDESRQLLRNEEVRRKYFGE